VNSFTSAAERAKASRKETISVTTFWITQPRRYWISRQDSGRQILEIFEGEVEPCILYVA
jgi:hypothetical protein